MKSIPPGWQATRGSGEPRPVESIAGADLTDADFSELRVYEPAAESAILRRGSFADFRCEGGNFNRADFTGAALDDAIFFDTQMVEVKMSGILMHRVQLSTCNLTRADLHGAELNNARLIGTDFTDAKLTSAIFDGAQLRSAIFTGADLTGASLVNSDCRKADFRGAKLKNVDFSGANLEGAHFDGGGPPIT